QRAEAANLQGLDKLMSEGVRIVELSDLPEHVAMAQQAPPALFAWGDIDCLRRPLVAIVGTRAATTYGKAVAQKFAEALAVAGVTIVSGGALGIDAAAHKGAIAAGGETVAVLLTGIERVYPRVHYGLFEEIKKNGCLLSQFAVGTSTSREYRPLIRNQTVAALSSAVIVVEAPERSGALSTAHAAVELGRQVFVVPANIDNVNFRGSHALIRDGATLVDHPHQVLEALDIVPVDRPSQSPEVTESQARILAVLTVQPLASEFIVERTGLDTAEVMSELTMLEVEGKVIRDAGGYAVRP
ncbi:MAG TPA: DNA-processing protein DprA, partial [Fimbriimonadaceae bacterium]|nr:DNA-processing protein DprA [Fimbriimonadaceae bacterium]